MRYTAVLTCTAGIRGFFGGVGVVPTHGITEDRRRSPVMNASQERAKSIFLTAVEIVGDDAACRLSGPAMWR